MQKVEKQSKNVFWGQRVLVERIKEDGGDIEGEAVCNCGVSWNHSVEPHILSA